MNNENKTPFPTQGNLIFPGDFKRGLKLGLFCIGWVNWEGIFKGRAYK